MKPEIAVLDIQSQYRVYTEFYRAEAAEATIVLVNGSLATTASFAQTVRNLHPLMNVVAYDPPYAGKSKPHNAHALPLTKELEGQILLELIEHFGADHLLSFSWGGAAALVALAHRPRRIKKAVISSFSPVINPALQDYLTQGQQHCKEMNRFGVGNLVNGTLGKYLPPLFKRFNHRHVSSLAAHEYAQMHHAIEHILDVRNHPQIKAAKRINIPVMFINGERDEYTTAPEAQLFSNHIRDCHFSTIENAGHFLDMESSSACHDTLRVLLNFLMPEQNANRAVHPPMYRPQAYAAQAR